MKKMEIEIQRHNVTPAQFLSYVRSQCKKKDIPFSDPGLAYFKDGEDLNFDFVHHGDQYEGLHEKSVSKPYQMQVYMKYPNGTTFNEIVEFDFSDVKTGVGYYYYLDIQNEDEEEIPNCSHTPEQQKGIYLVSFDYGDGIWCTNLASGTIDQVHKHYRKYDAATVREAKAWEIETYKKRGMPLIDCTK